MKDLRHILIFCAFACTLPACAGVHRVMAEPDSVSLFSYTTADDDGRSGLRFAWSSDGRHWTSIGNGRSYLRCDYSLWGSEKRMLKPEMYRSADGMWHCVWQLHAGGREFGISSSADLTDWRRQTYFTDARFTDCVQSSWTRYPQAEAVIGGASYSGTVAKVAWADVERLIRYAGYNDYRQSLYNECAAQDGVRFARLQPVSLTLTARPADTKAISDHLIGVFFEDINYGADGGLYAELVQNRDFEYAEGENGNVKGWGPAYAWAVEGSGASMTIGTSSPIHPNNPHYATIKSGSDGMALVNSGYDGITVRKGEKYNLSLFVRLAGSQTKAAKIRVSLRGSNGRELAYAVVKAAPGGWKKLKATLTASESDAKASLVVAPVSAGTYDFDMISLFPKNTFKGRANGLRADLAQTIADIRPRFVRFPGGCVAHGQGIDNIYRWKNSIGPLESRKPMKNLWGYHQTMGLGYFEYFQFCEDIGAMPLPVIAAGVPCQNSACIPGRLLGGGQQEGIPLDSMEAYIQDIIDLIDYANADPKTNKWARMRAEAGHPKPFNLKYIGIGNEDQITDVFEERFTMIYEAISSRRPGITVVGTVGPFYEGSDYEEGWVLADKLDVPVVDEHYYVAPGWFIHNQNFYDRYDRSKSKVYLGEYAAHLPGRPNNIETALSEALYLTSVERNGDVVEMASYAPLLAKKGHTQWNPDMIYFDNGSVSPTVGYYVQKMFGNNSGDSYIPADRALDNSRADVDLRVASSVVVDSNTGDVILKLVNMLPVEVNTTADLSSLTDGGRALLTVLSGSPSDTNAKPVDSSVTFGSKFSYAMPPYSFSVIRMSGKSK